jgi:hypothetical protein
MSSTTSVLFNGLTEHAVVSGDPSGLKKEYTDAFSWFAWAYTTNGTIQHLLTKFDSGDGRGIALYKETTSGIGGDPDNQLTVYISNSGANRIIVTTYSSYITNTLSSLGWRFVGFTYDGSGLASGVTIYIDGHPVYATIVADTLGANTIDNTTNFQVSGYGGTAGNEWVGGVDEVMLYDDELTESEVLALWDNYLENKTTPDPTLIGPTGDLGEWWQMGDGDTFPTLSAQINGAHDLTMTNMVAGDIVTAAPFPYPAITWDQIIGAGGAVQKNYRMRGVDSTCPASQQPAYVYWDVTDSPDITAAQADPGILICGSDPLTDIADITVYRTWNT